MDAGFVLVSTKRKDDLMKSINLEKYETGLCIALAVATIGSIGMSFITSSAITYDTQEPTGVETVVSTTMTDVTITSTSSTTSTTATTTTTSTTTSTSATIGTQIVEVTNDDGMIETIIIPKNEMLGWSESLRSQTTFTTTSVTTTTEATTMTTVPETTCVKVLDVEEVNNNSDNLISDADYILLCNCVAHEAGSNSIPASEKAKVVEVIMNRVYSSSYPDSIYAVITQRGQFSGASGYANLGDYSYKVNDLVKQGVDEYFANQDAYQHGYLSFYGDGHQNYFR
jgi:hypothetical protein